VSYREIKVGNPARHPLHVVLDDILEECSEEGWDGYGADPVSIKAADDARRAIKLLPDNIILPEVSADPSGSVDFSWDVGSGRDRHMFVVCFDGKGKIHYSGLFGPYREMYGVEEFGDKFPFILYGIIEKAFVNGGSNEAA